MSLPSLDLANTTYALRGVPGDEIATATELERWLVARAPALGVAPPYGAELGRAHELRDAVRALFAARAAGVRPEDSDVLALNAASRRAPAAALLLWGDEGAERSWERAGVDAGAAALAAIAQDAVALLAGPDGDALRACEGPRCVQFLLRGQPRREFCSDGCATRARAARYYARRRAEVIRGPAARGPARPAPG